ncbi:unnamed protein product [Aureobasidium uvarum]|uniref:USP domain-containing protein n=1 Tax=Aureobasidium uvarum TaxID=2773716 RepID=A0A9N8KWV1_9PEZI|nr:unnamed protein product [Aureobasidium uvarum]
MDPSPTSPAHSTGQRLSPSALPGRDHVADADTSHSRKRPRLSDEPDSPPPTNADSDTQNTSATGSPTVLEVPQEQSTEPSDITIIMAGDETTVDVHLNSFPFLFDKNDTPEGAAARFAEHCYTKNGPAVEGMICLINWLDGHLRETNEAFDAALKHNTSSSTIFDLYSDNAEFWNHILSCFRGLIGRCSISSDNGLDGSNAWNFFHAILDNLLCMGERLLYTEIAILKQREARRDSTSSPTSSNSPKHSLLFPLWADTFMDMTTRPREFLEPMSAAYHFSVKSVQRRSIGRFQGRAMDAIVTLMEHITSRSENIKSPFATVYGYVALCHHVLYVDRENVGNWLMPYFNKSAKLFDLVYTMTLHTLPKQHLDESSQHVIENFRGFLVDMLRALYFAKHLSAKAVFEMTMEDVANYQNTRGELLVPPEEDNTNSAPDDAAVDDGISFSAIKDDVLEAASIACALKFLNALLRSSSVDLRNRAAEQMGALAWEIRTNKRKFEAGYHRLLEDYTAKFFLANDITGYLLGPQSHATLIGRTTTILAFMAVTGKLTKRDADTIWTVSFHTQQPDDAQSAMNVLQTLPAYMSAFANEYFCNKFRALPLSKFSKEAERLLQKIVTEFLRTSTDGEYQTTYTCIQLLGKIEGSDIPPARQNQLLLSFAHLLLQIHSPRNSRESLRLLELCAAPIALLSHNVTGYVQALSSIVKQTGFSIRVEDIHGRVPFHRCVAELLQFLARAKTEAKFPVLCALWCRLDLITYVLSISSPGDNTAAIEKALWQNVLGEHALTPQLRDMGWRFFIHSYQSGQQGLEAFYNRFINQYLPDISPEFATTETINLFKVQYARQESDMTQLLPIGEELIRFALAVPSEEIANDFKVLLLESLFKGKAVNYPGLAIDGQISVIRQLIAQMSQEGVPATRASEILLNILIESNRYQALLQRPDKSTPSATPQPKSYLPQDSIRVPIRIHRGNAQPQSKLVTINKSASCSELEAAIASETGFASYTVVTAGQKINFAKEPEQSITKLGLREGNVLLVQKRNTFESIQEEANKSAEKSIVEGEIASHLDVLYGILDGTDRKAHCVLQILTLLKFPGPIRAMITAPELPFEQIFPPGASLRLRASVDVISIQLKEQVDVGVADEKFLLRAIHLLVDLLSRPDILQEVTDIWRTAETLLALLRERPVKDVTGQYFGDAAKFTHQILRYIEHFSHETTTVSRDGNKQMALRALYQCLLQGVLVSQSVCLAFVAEGITIPIHLALLITRSDHLRATIPKSIINAVQDERASPELKGFFSKLSLEHLIPTALKQPVICDKAFLVSIEALSADRCLSDDEGLLRTLIDDFAKTLLNMSHLERYGDCFIDKRISGLASLLRCCIQALVVQNKPLNLGSLPSQIFKTLLFPILIIDKKVQPVVASETRNSINDLLRLMCDNIQTLESLATNCEDVAGFCTGDQSFTFPGPDGYVRQEGNYAGLANLGQTCYFNSLLQQLFMNVQFRKFIFDTSVIDPKKQAVLVELKLAFASMQDSYDIFYQPDELVKALNVDHTVQDDAHIFFMTLVGQLEESMPDEQAKNALKAFFRGVNKSQTIGSCKHVSESTDEYFNLSLVVKDKASLEESLEEYTKGAVLEGSDKFRCTTCGSGEGVSVDAVQRTALEHIPDNLVFGLRRFRYETYDGGQKVNDRFDFPEYIDMSKYKLNRLAGVEGPGESDLFQLVGVVVHQGILTFGHYWSYAAERGRSDAEPLRWFRLEDKNVRLSSIAEVLSETCGGPVPSPATSTQGDQSPNLRSDNAYVLFYQPVSSISESAKCLATSSSVLPYTVQAKVCLPQDLEIKITKENEEKLFILNLFSLSHLEFVRSLASKLPTIKIADPSLGSRTTYKLMSMLLRYYTRVVANFESGFSPQSIDYTSLLLQKLACGGKDFARWMLVALLSWGSDKDRSKCLVVHYKRAVRHATKRLVVACLKYLREHDPEYLDTGDAVDSGDQLNIMTATVHSLIDLRSHILERGPAIWGEYFELLRDVAELGPDETCVLLEENVLEWCLEVLLINGDAKLQKKHPDVMKHIAAYPRKLNYVSIVNCIYGLLCKFVDLRGPAAFHTGNRWTDSQTLLLTADEHDYLVERSNSYGNNLVELCMQGLGYLKRSNSSDCPPTLLIGLLTNVDRVSTELYDDAVRALIVNLRCATDWDMIAESVLHCLLERKLKSTTEQDIFREMINVLSSPDVSQQNQPTAWKMFCITMGVFKVHPQMIMQYLAVITRLVLVCDRRILERDARDWLRNSVLVQNVLPKPYVLDQIQLLNHKVWAIKELLAGLAAELNTGMARNFECSIYEYSIDAYQDCGKYLSQVSSSLETELEEWLKSEGPETEADAELETAVQELFDEVSNIDKLLNDHEDCRNSIRDWQDEQSVSDAPSNSNVVEIDNDSDNEFMESDDSLSDAADFGDND